MSARDDESIIDDLYAVLEGSGGNPRAIDPKHQQELESLVSTVRALRQLEPEAPPSHVDAVILARARAMAEKVVEEPRDLGARLRRLMRSPILGLGVTATVAGLLALSFVPSVRLEGRSPSSVAHDEPRLRSPAEPASAKMAESAPAPAQPKRETEVQRSADSEEAESEMRPAHPLRALPKRAQVSSPSEREASKQSAQAAPVAGLTAGDDARVASLPRAPAPVSSMSGELDGAAGPPFVRSSAEIRNLEGGRASSAGEAQKIDRASSNEAKADSLTDARARFAAAIARLAAGDRLEGRALLESAQVESRGSELEPHVLLRLAELDFAEGRYAASASHARRAASHAAFPEKDRARARTLAARAERALGVK